MNCSIRVALVATVALGCSAGYSAKICIDPGQGGSDPGAVGGGRAGPVGKGPHRRDRLLDRSRVEQGQWEWDLDRRGQFTPALLAAGLVTAAAG